MLYILDLGANDGCSIRKFKKEYLKSVENYKIISYEPHPFFYNILKNENNSNITIINKAVSIHNNKSKFYYSVRPDGSSLNETKTSNGINKEKFFLVDCIDICDVINNLNLKNNDKLWLKMDIEGEEYNIIPHLYKNNMLKYVNKMFIEWHQSKLKNITLDKHNDCVNMLKNISCQEWDALNYAYDLNKKYNEFCNDL